MICAAVRGLTAAFLGSLYAIGQSRTPGSRTARERWIGPARGKFAFTPSMPRSALGSRRARGCRHQSGSRRLSCTPRRPASSGPISAPLTLGRSSCAWGPLRVPKASATFHPGRRPLMRSHREAGSDRSSRGSIPTSRVGTRCGAHRQGSWYTVSRSPRGPDPYAALLRVNRSAFERGRYETVHHALMAGLQTSHDQGDAARLDAVASGAEAQQVQVDADAPHHPSATGLRGRPLGMFTKAANQARMRAVFLRRRHVSFHEDSARGCCPAA